jgi:hypothetical protein
VDEAFHEQLSISTCNPITDVNSSESESFDDDYQYTIKRDLLKLSRLEADPRR